MTDSRDNIITDRDLEVREDGDVPRPEEERMTETEKNQPLSTQLQVTLSFLLHFYFFIVLV